MGNRASSFQGYIPVWVQLVDKKPFMLINFMIFCYGTDKTGDCQRLGCDQRIYVAVGRLTIQVTVLWMDRTVSLVDSFLNRIVASSDVDDVTPSTEAVDALHLCEAVRTHCKSAEYTITVRVQKTSIGLIS